MNTTPEQKKILQIYGALGATLVLSFIPSTAAALLSALMLGGVLIAAYGLRSKALEDSLTDNHMTFIIRTIWIGGFFAVVSVALGSAYLLFNHDQEPLNICAQNLIGSDVSMTDIETVSRFFEGCIEHYWTINKTVLMISMAISAGPAPIYFIVRYARGLSRALDGYRVSKPRAWF